MRVIIISNRLPITVKRSDDGSKFIYKECSGGLVTGLKCLKQSMDFMWLGNISGSFNDAEKEIIKKEIFEKYKAVPVFITEEINQLAYNGFCNSNLWPLLHSFPDDLVFSYTNYEGYCQYNRIFAEKVKEIWNDGDVIWVHDYHLMLVPGYLREYLKCEIETVKEDECFAEMNSSVVNKCYNLIGGGPGEGKSDDIGGDIKKIIKQNDDETNKENYYDKSNMIKQDDKNLVLQGDNVNVINNDDSLEPKNIGNLIIMDNNKTNQNLNNLGDKNIDSSTDEINLIGKTQTISSQPNPAIIKREVSISNKGISAREIIEPIKKNEEYIIIGERENGPSNCNLEFTDLDQNITKSKPESLNSTITDTTANTLNFDSKKENDMLNIQPQPTIPKFTKRMKKIKIGFFLHTPFPEADIFNVLPVREQIVLSLMCSDSVAFHSYDYVNNFINTCKEIIYKNKIEDYNLVENLFISENFYNEMNINDTTCTCVSDVTINSVNSFQECFCKSVLLNRITFTSNKIDYKGRYTKVKAIPIGIDPMMFRETLAKDECQARIHDLLNKFRGKKIILGVDRTDYIKGIPHRIMGFNRLIKDNPDLKKSVVFFQVGVPSRIDVAEYSSLVSVINERIAIINATTGGIDDNIFYFLNNSVSFEELCALYAVADVCIVSSLIDGMNLVALEYIACQSDKNGVLILSEFAGAGSTLPGALTVNPWNIDGLAKSLKVGLDMSTAEKSKRFDINKIHVDKFTAFKWAEDNLKLLKED